MINLLRSAFKYFSGGKEWHQAFERGPKISSVQNSNILDCGHQTLVVPVVHVLHPHKDQGQKVELDLIGKLAECFM